jgi:integrase
MAVLSQVKSAKDAKIMGIAIANDEAPTTVNSQVKRTREYLTSAEIERLIEAARKTSRYGHRDATMILIAYRHGLRASELCDLQWSQVELNTGRLHVRRSKRGTLSEETKYAPYDVYSANRRHPRLCSAPSAAGQWRRRAFTM